MELLVQLVHKISVRAEKKVEDEISGEFRRVAGRTGILVKLAAAALAKFEEIVRTALYPVVGVQTLKDVVAEAHQTGAEIDRQYTDTHGASAVGFAFAHLLDFALLARLATIGSARLYRPGLDRSAAWARLATTTR